MNLCVAVGASHILGRLVVSRSGGRLGAWKCSAVDPGVALQAERINVADIEKARIRRSMWRVARDASLRLQDRMFEDEWSRGLRMALHAHCILVASRSHGLSLSRSMGIMAVAAGHQTFIHLVMEGLGEGRLHIGMAAVAEPGLRSFEEADLFFKSMNAMAAGATYTCLAVSGALEVRMSADVTAQAGLIDLLCRSLREAKDLRDIASTLDVRLPCAVAALTGDALTAMHKRQPSMGISTELLCQVGMTCFADLRADVIGRIMKNGILLGDGLFRTLCRLLAGAGRLLAFSPFRMCNSGTLQAGQ